MCILYLLYLRLQEECEDCGKGKFEQSLYTSIPPRKTKGAVECISAENGLCKKKCISALVVNKVRV